MNKFEVLQAFGNGRIAYKDACLQLDLTEKGLAMTLRAYGPHLDWLVKTLSRLDTKTKPEQTEVKRKIAAKLNVTYNQVNRMLRRGKVSVPTPKIVQIRAEIAENAQKRRENTQKVIKNLAKGRISAENAQKTLKISERQVARHLSRLVTGIGYQVPDWRKLSRSQRARLVTQHAG